ncbi:hypothetical protein IC575_017829 [Cucumis melo]|uniref:Uncharacterized protein LOC103494614 isoform X1 n=1 Tax=Cucumis melo TaxID=3656 RepID=A0A1S3BZ25_CUCME|nr:uncharacterized protein LOC103494614 isoform X1 [Cucumis melo]
MIMGSRNGVQVVMKIALVFLLVSSSWIFPETLGQEIPSSNSLLQDGRDFVQKNDGLEAIKEEDDTVRVDPLNHFHKYRSGYNITNKHYWSSTVFTGAAGYGIGVVWLVCGIAYGGFLVVATLCCGKGSRGKPKLKKMPHLGQEFYLWTILLAAFFTILAIVGCGVVIGGSTRFDKEAKNVVKIIIETANGASNTIQNTTSAMKDMISNLEASRTTGRSYSIQETSGTLTSTSHNLDAQAANIQWQANKNRLLIHKGLNIVYIVTMVTMSLNLGAVVAMAVFGILRLQRLFHLFILLCWILTVLCWIFFGLYLFLNNFSSDTCKALEMFQENPNNNSLSSILPCEQLLTAKSVLTDVSSEIYDLVNQVNTQIAISYPDIALVCNPFSQPPYYEYQPQNCAANTIRIGDIPKVLKLLTCADESNGGCENGQFMSNFEYRTVEAYTNSIQDFLNVYPGMENLVECQTVKDAFSKILEHHCKPLEKYAYMVWVGLVFVSIVMVCLVLIWTIRANIDQKLHHFDGSVQPNSSTPKMMEMANH